MLAWAVTKLPEGAAWSYELNSTAVAPSARRRFSPFCARLLDRPRLVRLTVGQSSRTPFESPLNRTLRMRVFRLSHELRFSRCQFKMCIPLEAKRYWCSNPG
jgi:hypothetical protein